MQVLRSDCSQFKTYLDKGNFRGIQIYQKYVGKCFTSNFVAKAAELNTIAATIEGDIAIIKDLDIMCNTIKAYFTTVAQEVAKGTSIESKVEAIKNQLYKI